MDREQSCAIMGGMDADEPSELDSRLERARDRYDRAYTELLAAIDEALDAGYGPSRIARYARWTREYIAQIRDGKTGRSKSRPGRTGE